MPPSHLKIMFKISDDSVVNFVELTSGMLEYNGVKKLEKYPIFDPTIEFNSELREKIMGMSYDKKIEVFFNTDTFNRKIVNAIELKYDGGPDKAKGKMEAQIPEKIVEKEIGKMEAQIPEKIVEKEIIKADSSFEFIIQCIFCIGLPLTNYYKTIEYYDIAATKNKLIASKSMSFFDFLKVTPHKKCFSYIKLNGKKYTVTGLTWINDVLNHPVYMDILMKYNKYDIERKKVEPGKNAKALNLKLNRLILDIYDLDIYDLDISYNQSQAAQRRIADVKWGDVRRQIETLFKKIKTMKKMNPPPKLFLLDIDNNADAKKLIKDYRIIKEAYDKETDAKKPHRLRELLLSYNDLVQNTDNKHGWLKTVVDEFNNDHRIHKFKIEIKQLSLDYTDEDFQDILRGTRYNLSFIRYFRTLKTLFLKENMYEIILNGLTYQDRTPSEIREMDALIENEVKNYFDFRQAVKKIHEDRVISNNQWKKETDIINGEALFLEKNDIVKKEDFFEILMECNKKNNECQIITNQKAVSYLEIGLEQVNKTDKSSFTYEAYINLEVAEGVYNESNYHKLMCPYISNVLGDSYDEMIRKEGKNNVMRNRVFVKSTPDPITNKKLQYNNNNIKMPRKFLKKSPKKKGGTKKRKRGCRKTR